MSNPTTPLVPTSVTSSVCWHTVSFLFQDMVLMMYTLAGGSARTVLEGPAMHRLDPKDFLTHLEGNFISLSVGDLQVT